LAFDAILIIECVLLDAADARFGQIIELMRSSGYECFDIIEPEYRFDDVLWQADLVFVRRESKFRSNRNFYNEEPQSHDGPPENEPQQRESFAWAFWRRRLNTPLRAS
jgi:hypothetical protein